MGRINPEDKIVIDSKYGLTRKQSDFCIYYVELGNATQAAIKAGYSVRTAKNQASTLLTKQGVKNKIYDLQHDATKLKIASAQEVMDFFTRVMNGEVKDQFNLEASLSDRLKAANELAKRTVDVEQKADKLDNQIHIKLEWGKDDDEKDEDHQEE